MNKDTRIERIKEVKKRGHILSQEIHWQGDLVPMKVFKIPLELLVYNKYNGRILSRTKSLENQKHRIDAESDEGREIIENLLWESKPDRNKKTMQDIYDFEQQKVGIITKDGVIIDGNRRVMLLNRLLKNPKLKDKYRYFKAIVLPVTSEENPIEIEELETKYQMGEDEKLGYNATEKYLKAKQIYIRLTNNEEINLKKLNKEAITKISDWMGESISEVEKYMSVMMIMDEYLTYNDYDGIYTQLDSREDQFLSLDKWLNTFYNTESRKGFDGYANADVDDLKTIAFDYLRIRNKYDGKEFRNLAEGAKANHFFGDKEIWNTFSSRHFEIIEQIPNEDPIDFDSTNLAKHLDARNNDFFKQSKFGSDESEFLENINNHKTSVGYKKASEQPEKLIKKASQAIDAIKTGHSSFVEPNVQELVEELGNKVTEILVKTSPSKVLNNILKMLESIEIKEISDIERDKVKEASKKISSHCYHNFDKKL